jgi:hypothetical protein
MPRLEKTFKRRRLSAQRRQALELLASTQSGTTKTVLFAHGVTPYMFELLVRSGLATIQRGLVAITDAGRRAIRVGRT